MIDSRLTELSTKISIDSINICNLLFDIEEYEIGNNLKRACANIEANIIEARYAENRNDFIRKLHLALKECNECIYWLDIIRLRLLLESNDSSDLYNNCYIILRLLKASIEVA
jgi:four helix bundle protein